VRVSFVAHTLAAHSIIVESILLDKSIDWCFPDASGCGGVWRQGEPRDCLTCVGVKKAICSQEVRASVLTLYSMMNVLGRASMVTNLETNFSKFTQIGVGKTTRCLKGMQQVFGQSRGMGGKITPHSLYLFVVL